ncbi:aspartate 1-decarboxylase [Candidatus Kaiserbacteria bacterium RIFCSPLOWO2_01_FULL_52_12b]|uniref:Aspartate 1-decarboxylase n=1 Tax=Candidatus Kaiserbacteria bacterium RIFCSPLOWO2_01_FULL_52_12b TaxID=1798509 RepID=A0A1F6EXC4_9BACT|nr:MAG: aspartate 1-decarboxylase [Candidatus Kaiserbacteria bacterium RIFCSPLOWO2_01_FULL_52_12b]
MLVNVCIAKLHRATVTDADLDYMGSITIDRALLEASGLLAGQMVMINNLSNAASWRTYILEGKKGKGDIVLNGPPSRLFQKGDKVIILGEAWVSPTEAARMSPTVVFMDEKNRVTRVKKGWHPD